MYKLQKNLLAAGLSSSVLMGGGSANAALITFENSIDNYLSQGDSLSGAFNINSFLGEQSSNGFDVTANSATIRVYGYSSEVSTPSYQQYTGSFIAGYQAYYYSYSYSCGWSTCYGTSYGGSYAVRGNTYNNFIGDGETDTAVLDFGDQQVSDDTSSADTYINTTRPTYYTKYDNYDRNEWGSIYDSLALSDFSLGDLMSDGVLNYVLKVESGHFDNFSLFLDFDYDAILKPTVSSVSEPGTLGILGLGTLGLLASRRKSRK